jgi:hypothetical protein
MTQQSADIQPEQRALVIENDPVSTSVRLRPPETPPPGRFTKTDPGIDLTESKHFGRILNKMLHDRKFQFFLILPNQIIFWIVIATGIFGITTPGRNFGPAITWYLWFALVFVITAVIGRGWCAMCPFGGFGEWIQRRTLFQRTQKALGLGKKLPESWAGYGLLISTAAFVILTFIEEFFNIAGPGAPIATSIMVIGIVSFATLSFLLFERRTFCRYLCPLSSLVATVGSMGSVAGFRTKDRDVCLTCSTKDCMRGGEDGFGCPWYTWPGSADSNSFCGLCSECYKSCPSDNIGLFVQKPMTSVVAPSKRRLDVGLAVAILLGLVLYQQYNAMAWFTPIDNWLNKAISFPHYPNPVDYFGGIILVVAFIWLGVTAIQKVNSRNKGRASTIKWFTAFAYALIPITGFDYFARQLPKFFKHVTRVPSAVLSPLGIHLGIYNTRLLTNPQIVTVQVGFMGLGTAFTLWAVYRIARTDLHSDSKKPIMATAMVISLAVIICLTASVLYLPMHAAS